MPEKTSTEVIIGGKVYRLSGYEGEEYLQRVAAYINHKRDESYHTESCRRLQPDMRAVLLELNIADDYFKAKAQVEKLERELEKKEKEIYELKHQMISVQISAENEEKERKRLEEENRELLKEKEVLEELLSEEEVPAEKKKKKAGAPYAGGRE